MGQRILIFLAIAVPAALAGAYVVPSDISHADAAKLIGALAPLAAGVAFMATATLMRIDLAAFLRPLRSLFLIFAFYAIYAAFAVMANVSDDAIARVPAPLAYAEFWRFPVASFGAILIQIGLLLWIGHKSR